MIKGRYVAQIEVDFHINDEMSDLQFNAFRHQITGGLTNFIKNELDFELGADKGYSNVKVVQQYADLYRARNENE